LNYFLLLSKVQTFLSLSVKSLSATRHLIVAGIIHLEIFSDIDPPSRENGMPWQKGKFQTKLETR